MTRAFLCELREIPDGGACERLWGEGSKALRIVLLRRGSEVWGYMNLCPHFRIPLDYEPGVFSTYGATVVMCAHHSSMFRFEDGVCFEGPCRGERLAPVALRVAGGRVYVGAQD